jgi:integrase
LPLARQIVILRELHRVTGQGEYVFPAVDSVRRCMSNNTPNAALRRLGCSKEEVSVSGFRATASTLLNEMGPWNPDAIERQLAHMEENDVRRAYMQRLLDLVGRGNGFCRTLRDLIRPDRIALRILATISPFASRWSL